MRIAASLASLILLLNITAAAVAADDPLMKQAQGLFQPIPSEPPAIKGVTTTPAMVALGKDLYFDPRLSLSHNISCNTCHQIGLGGVDMLPVSIGHKWQKGGRNAPTVWNSAFHSVQFWDGRAPLLEDQAKGPVANPVEMGMKDVETAMERVRRIPGYKAYFDKAFGENSMTVDNAAKAVAAFERTLITPNSPYDKYVKGDKKAMSEQQVRGMDKFAATGCTRTQGRTTTHHINAFAANHSAASASLTGATWPCSAQV